MCGQRNAPWGPEEVLASGVRYEAAVALKIRVVPACIAAAGVNVGAVNVGLPDFDIAVAQRLAGFGQHAAGKIYDFADRRRDPFIQD
jgi:hypothetical protein